MLALTRKQEQEVFLFVGKIKITCKVLHLDDNRVRLGFDAPPEVTILRSEIYEVTRRLPDCGGNVAKPDSP
jgi:carbon storage regulator CsrA